MLNHDMSRRSVIALWSKLGKGWCCCCILAILSKSILDFLIQITFIILILFINLLSVT